MLELYCYHKNTHKKSNFVHLRLTVEVVEIDSDDRCNNISPETVVEIYTTINGEKYNYMSMVLIKASYVQRMTNKKRDDFYSL